MAARPRTSPGRVGDFPGDYFKLDPVATPDDLRHSPAHPGEIILGVTPGLLELTPQDEFAVYFHGWGVRAGAVARGAQPAHNSLLKPGSLPTSSLDPKYFYCLVESTGPQGLGPKKTGWGLYLGPSDLDNPDPAGPLFWQVWMGDGTNSTEWPSPNLIFPPPGFHNSG